MVVSVRWVLVMVVLARYADVCIIVFDYYYRVYGYGEERREEKGG
jgi:hypothetical protein